MPPTDHPEPRVEDPRLPRRTRLAEPQDFQPWVRAEEEQLPGCALFWLPVSSWPARWEERTWILEFTKRFQASLEGSAGLRGEIFLQYKSVQGELVDPFFRYTQKSLKLMGLARHPGQPMPSLPSPEEIRKLVEDKREVDVRNWVAEFAYWFVAKQPEQQRELFLGHGGLTHIFLPPDPKTRPPKLPFTPALRASLPVFQQFDVDAIHAATYALNDRFLKQSKELFGEGLEDRPEYPGITFILPLLDSAHFFAADRALRDRWFSLFEVYLRESPKDKGLLLACQQEKHLATLFDVLETMRRDGLKYTQEARWTS